jgi:iron(III) transport system substrate-binding protein
VRYRPARVSSYPLRRWSLPLALGLALLTFGCATPSSPPARVAPAAEPAPATEWETTLAAARREGAVTLSASPHQAMREAIMKFQDAYPEIRVEYNALAGPDFEARVRSEREAGIYHFDAHVSGIPPTVYTDHIPAGWFAPIKPALLRPDVLDDSKWLGGLDAAFADQGKTYVFGYALSESNSLKVNREFVAAETFNSFEDLLRPEVTGKIAILDPTRASGGSLYLTVIRLVLGDEAIRRLLVDQRPAITQDRRQIAEWLIRGRQPIAIGASDDGLKPFAEQGLGGSIRSVQSDKRIPAGNGNGTVLLLSRPPHPNAQKVFINWLLSQDGQTALARVAGQNSRRLDVPAGNPDEAPDPAKAHLYINLSAEENRRFTDETLQLAQRLLP